MNQCHYADIIEALCKIIRPETIQPLLQHGQLELEQVWFTLSYDPLTASDSMTVYCDYGEPDAWLAAHVYRAALGSNQYLFHAGKTQFCVLPGSGHVALVSRLSLHGLSATELLRWLRQQAAGAQQWRRHYWLGRVAAAPAKPAPTTVDVRH